MLNEHTFEFSQARLKLKESLKFSMRQTGGLVRYLVEDEVSGRFFQIGLAQYTFLTMLDGNRTVSTALMKTATLLREDAISENDAASLCKWGIESGLIETEVGDSPRRRQEHHDQRQKQRMVTYLNPMMMRIPLFNPDPAINTLSRFFNFLITPLGLLVWVIVVVFGFFQLATNWNSFYLNRVNSFSASDLIWIGITWLVLKLIHELAHSLVCKSFGGRVQSCGFLLLLMIPLPYVDVTSSWRFDNKWKRILTSAAGMMAELFIAAIACCIWAWNDPGPLQYHAGNIIITATVTTLLFNINPLMRFDGYYMLADWLEIPNLSTHGRQWFKGLFKWVYFGTQRPKVIESGLRGLAVRAYGIMAMLWFLLIAVGLSLAASNMIEGFGLLIALVGCVLWIGIPVFRLIKYVAVGSEVENPNRGRFALATLITALVVGSFLYLCPSPSVVSAPLVVDYKPLSIVRVTTPGFARKILVTDGQFVNEGDKLIEMENKELQHDLNSLVVDIEISKLRINNLLTAERISEVQIEQESLEAKTKRKIEIEQQLEELIVRAPSTGKVIARGIDSNLNKYFKVGDELLTIGDPQQIHALALTRQSDIEWLEQDSVDWVDMMVWGRHQGGLMQGRIKTINPRARVELPHEAFAASIGGPLAVVPQAQVEGEKGGQSDQMVLTEPRVPVEIELQTKDIEHLIPGQTGHMIVRGRSQNMGSYLSENFIRYIRKQSFRSHGL